MNHDNEILQKVINEYRRLEENEEKENLPILSLNNITYHIVFCMLEYYRKNEFIEDNYWMDHLNNLSMIKISCKNKENFCCISIGSNNCDKEKKIFVITRYLRENNYDFGIFISKYNWYLLKDNEIVESISFENEDPDISKFTKFLCWK